MRIRLSHPASGMFRGLTGYVHIPRRCNATCLLIISAGFLLTMFLFDVSVFRLPHEEAIEHNVADVQTHLHFLKSLYRSRQEDLLALQVKNPCGKNSTHYQISVPIEGPPPTVSLQIMALVKNMTGSRTAAGLHTSKLDLIQAPFEFQLMPHLMDDHNSLRPAFHMKSSREFVQFVIGIPTVKRDKESYLTLALEHLVYGLTDEDINGTLIIIFIGETDMEYVLKTARLVERLFTREVTSGLIEVLSPSASYYPNLDEVPLTLGDSRKRVNWRTKQNLDAIYLMAYAQTKGMFYLMLEDDVIAQNNYMLEIKQFTAETSVTTPDWFFLKFCHVGGIGKLFRTSNLLHFIFYVQLFYKNMPIDWLLESYLADRVCTIEKNSNNCLKNKQLISPRYKTSLFQHIGLYSSLKGKIQKVKNPQFGPVPTYYPHTNPPLKKIHTTIMQRHPEHTAQKAYDGDSFFWGDKLKKGDILEFWFENPVNITSFTFRSGNIHHGTDKFYDAVVEVLPAYKNDSFVAVGSFDEFGLADGEIKESLRPLLAIRLRITKDSVYWGLLSEIELHGVDQMDLM